MSNVKWNQEVVDKINKDIIKRLTISAELVETSAKQKTPVDTGRLRASINYKVEKDVAIIGTNVEYAPYIEYGHSKKAPGGFLRPAFDENIRRIKQIMGAKI